MTSSAASVSVLALTVVALGACGDASPSAPAATTDAASARSAPSTAPVDAAPAASPGPISPPPDAPAAAPTGAPSSAPAVASAPSPSSPGHAGPPSKPAPSAAAPTASASAPAALPKGPVAGKPWSLVASATADAGYHCNPDYPNKLTTSGGTNVTYPEPKVKGTCAGDQVVATIPIVPTAAGPGTVVGTLSYGICDDKKTSCLMKKKDVTLSFVASP